MIKNKLCEILAMHKAWLDNPSKGKRADLTGADLADANLTRANLTRANLTRANLADANLADANLADANLTGANLTRANLADANLTRTVGILNAGQDPRGYRFVGIRHNDNLMIAAGCRWFTLSQAKKHWSAKGNEDALLRVALIEAWANRGYH